MSLPYGTRREPEEHIERIFARCPTKALAAQADWRRG